MSTESRTTHLYETYHFIELKLFQHPCTRVISPNIQNGQKTLPFITAEALAM